jgi:SAM-dependent methyltransferase
VHGGRARALAEATLPGRPVADLGCGPGGYAPYLAVAGHAVVGVDAAAAMVAAARARQGERGARADLEALPFRYQSLGGAWAHNSYLHVPAGRLPMALAHLHHAMAVGAPVTSSRRTTCPGGPSSVGSPSPWRGP